jgi:phosphoribosyl-ATP pyrophosphohydrolase/phosphoribosyl-AMP cyclohydrolase
MSPTTSSTTEPGGRSARGTDVTTRGTFDAQALDWSKGGGLLPAIVQHWRSGAVLMLGYMNPEALAATIDSGNVTFFSRSKGRLWTKGETSGHFLLFKDVRADCDRDALLLRAEPVGPTCHLGTVSCFGEDGACERDAGVGVPGGARGTPANAPCEARSPAAVVRSARATSASGGLAFLEDLDALVATRARELPAGSYTTRLFEAGIRRIAQKVGEEAVEAALAATAQDDAELLGESADLLYHLIVLLRARGKSLVDVTGVLEGRHAKPTSENR